MLTFISITALRALMASSQKLLGVWANIGNTIYEEFYNYNINCIQYCLLDQKYCAYSYYHTQYGLSVTEPFPQVLAYTCSTVFTLYAHFFFQIYGIIVFLWCLLFCVFNYGFSYTLACYDLVG